MQLGTLAAVKQADTHPQAVGKTKVNGCQLRHNEGVKLDLKNK